jgi:uncharacterized RDD family membrane protein YckC
MSSSQGPRQPNELVLAKWSDRFFAWVIDFIIVNIAVWSIFGAAVAAPFDGDLDGWVRNGAGPVPFIATSLVFFAYWTLMESARGQSIGKMALKLKTTDLEGRTPDIKSAAIQSFGKSFLLVIDVAAGWIFTNDKRQRIFSRASHTIVVKEQGDDGARNPENVRYTKS